MIFLIKEFIALSVRWNYFNVELFGNLKRYYFWINGMFKKQLGLTRKYWSVNNFTGIRL